MEFTIEFYNTAVGVSFAAALFLIAGMIISRKAKK